MSPRDPCDELRMLISRVSVYAMSAGDTITDEEAISLILASLKEFSGAITGEKPAPGRKRGDPPPALTPLQLAKLRASRLRIIEGANRTMRAWRRKNGSRKRGGS